MKSLVAYMKERVPLYRERLAEVEARDVASLDDLLRLREAPRSDSGKIQRVTDLPST